MLRPDLAMAPLLSSRSIPALVAIALLPGPRPDLDVAVPPGSPLDWGRAFPAITPPRRPLFPRSGKREGEDEARSTSRPATVELDVRYSSSFALVRILTWDLTGHLAWIGPQAALGPMTGRRPFEPDPPRYGDALYWVTLAPLLRLMLHPGVVSRAETLAHLVEIGTPCLAVLDTASQEKSLVGPCAELRRLVTVAEPVPKPPASDASDASDASREAMLARFVFDELARDDPYDPEGTFGRRIFLFHEEVEPILRRYASEPAPGLQRRAVAALARYDTQTAESQLFDTAFLTDDPVLLVRALAGLGRVRSNRVWTPLVERLAETEDPVLAVAMIGALGRVGAREAQPTLLEVGARALESRDSELLMPVLAALARIPAKGHEAEIEPLLGAVEEAASSRPSAFAPPGVASNNQPDRRDPTNARAQILTRLSLFVRIHLHPSDADLARALTAVVTDARRLDPSVPVGLLTPTHVLADVPPPIQLAFLDALAAVGSAGLEILRSTVRDPSLEAPLRGYALGRLPWEERSELAPGIAADAEESSEMRLQALELLLADRHPEAEKIARGLLVECAALPSGAGGPARRYLGLRAVRALSEKGVLTAADLLPLVHHVRSPRHSFDQLPLEVREGVVDLVGAAASGMQKVDLRERIAVILEVVVRNKMNPAIDEETRRDAAKEVERKLENVRAHRSDPGYVKTTVEEVLEYLLGYGGPVGDPLRADFAPEVLLEDEIVLALGRTRDPRAAEPLVQILSNRRNESRAVACLALGMLGQPSTARELAPFLLDEDPFTRFCAYESLRRLTGEDHFVDWMYGPSEERFRAAEEYWKELVKPGR